MSPAVEASEQPSSKHTKRAKARRPVRLIVLGVMGRIPVPGVLWQVLHYLEGFRRLGLDVYYIEDTETWPYNPEENTVTDDCTYAVNAIRRTLASYGFADRWAYRSVTDGGRCFGLSDARVRQLFAEADILINLTASTILRDEHLQVPLRVYLETDPVMPQIEVTKGNSFYINLLAAHTHHFSYGENLGAPDCGVPIQRFHYLPTRQPIVLDWWTSATQSKAGTATTMPSACFTTVANWRQSNKDIEWNGENYTWSKHHEFLKFIDLPRRVSHPLELALALESGKATPEKGWMGLKEEDADVLRLLNAHGWRVVNAISLSPDLFSYRDYILGSRGEFTVAKDQNVRLCSGWFSDRSACYLAAGRPVITQDTGFDKFLPTGEGLFSFRNMEEILEAFDAINSDYAKHSRAARAIAEQHFNAETVLAKLIEDLGVVTGAG